MTPMKKLIATVTIIATLGVGAFALSTVLPAGAQSSPPAQSDAKPDGHRGERVRAVLDKLVQDGTISKDQADAVFQALKDEFPGKEGHPRLRRLIHGALQVSADTIGIPLGDLKAELKAGKSIADVANEHNVSPDTVKQALVDAGTKRLNEAVDNGRITRERADALIQKLPAVADTLVNAHRGDKDAGD